MCTWGRPWPHQHRGTVHLADLDPDLISDHGDEQSTQTNDGPSWVYGNVAPPASDELNYVCYTNLDQLYDVFDPPVFGRLPVLVVREEFVRMRQRFEEGDLKNMYAVAIRARPVDQRARG